MKNTVTPFQILNRCSYERLQNQSGGFQTSGSRTYCFGSATGISAMLISHKHSQMETFQGWFLVSFLMLPSTLG